MAKKATHYGICQACGSRQKLPNGVLSIHGYTVRNGWFQGVCPGTANLPFEISKDLIESFIAGAERSRDSFRRRAAEHLAIPFGSAQCWSKVYHPELSGRRIGSVYLWHEGRIEAPEGKQLVFVYDDRGREGRDQLHTWGKPESVAAEKRKAFAASLEADAAREERYIAWQRRRIAGWAPQPLVPIDLKAKAPEAADFDADILAGRA
jgi:hypothetical protein